MLATLTWHTGERRQVIEIDGESKLPGRDKREREAAIKLLQIFILQFSLGATGPISLFLLPLLFS